MHELSALLGIAAAIAVGAISPGPSFVMVARTAVASSRVAGMYAALGMGIGGLMFAIAALVGLQGVLLAAPSLYWFLKIVGGAYLIYLGVRIWLGASQPLRTEGLESASSATRPPRSFVVALLTQISNPKAAVIYASVFAAFLPQHASLALRLSIACAVLVIETGWYAIVALVLSSERPRHAYLRYKTWIDRAAGGIMMALGIKLVASAHR